MVDIGKVEVEVSTHEVSWKQRDLNLRVSLQDLIDMAKQQFPEAAFEDLYVSGSRHQDTVGTLDVSELVLENH